MHRAKYANGGLCREGDSQLVPSEVELACCSPNTVESTTSDLNSISSANTWWWRCGGFCTVMWITLLYLWSLCSYYTVFVYIWLKLVVFISLLCCQNGSKGMPLTSPKMSFSEQKSYCVGIRWDERKGDLSPGFLWFLWSFSCIEDMSRHGWGQGWVTSLLCTADISLNSVLKVSTLSARHVWSLLQAQPWHEAYWWPCSVTFRGLRVTWHCFK